MGLKISIRPTKGKIITSLIMIPLFYIYHYIFNAFCGICGEYSYEKWPEIIPSCCVVGTTFSQFLFEIYIVFILPFVMTYLIYSIICALIKKNKI
jgi:hypothetical protein